MDSLLDAAFSGAMISVATPATPDHRLDLDAYRSNLRFMVERGTTTGRASMLVAAAGGEFPMLSVEQRKTLMEEAVAEVSGAVPVVASIQSNSTREAVELATHALKVGVAAGQLSAPFYYPPTPGDIVRFFTDVAATGLPIMIYNNWWNTLNMNLDTVERLSQIDGVVALKWSAPTFTAYVEGFRRFAGRLSIVDNALNHVTSSLMGATGFITHISNFWPEYPLRLWDLMRERRCDELVEALAFKYEWRQWTERVCAYTEGEGPFIKAAMQEVGLPTGDPFPPSRPVPADLRAELSDLFERYQVPAATQQPAASR